MRLSVVLLCVLLGKPANAATFDFPPPEFDLLGGVRVVVATEDETLLDIARRHDIGQEEILAANPDVDRWLPGEGARVVLPSFYVLPASPHTGLVLNLPEMRLYFFPEPEPEHPREIQTYPVSIGRMEWSTPLGDTKVISKQTNPTWRPPASIRAEHEVDGDPLPLVVLPGPDNPLGAYAIYLGIPGYLIHSTNKVYGVGMRVSHGCIRMLPEDIEVLYPQVPVGTTVRIINQPVKAGWHGGDLYVEIHPPLEEQQVSPKALRELAMIEIDNALFKRSGEIDEALLTQALAALSGVPTVISQEPARDE